MYLEYLAAITSMNRTVNMAVEKCRCSLSSIKTRRKDRGKVHHPQRNKKADVHFLSPLPY
jgi:hypothetical protein